MIMCTTWIFPCSKPGVRRSLSSTPYWKKGNHLPLSLGWVVVLNPRHQFWFTIYIVEDSSLANPEWVQLARCSLKSYHLCKSSMVGAPNSNRLILFFVTFLILCSSPSRLHRPPNIAIPWANLNEKDRKSPPRHLSHSITISIKSHLTFSCKI